MDTIYNFHCFYFSLLLNLCYNLYPIHLIPKFFGVLFMLFILFAAAIHAGLFPYVKFGVIYKNSSKCEWKLQSSREFSWWFLQTPWHSKPRMILILIFQPEFPWTYWQCKLPINIILILRGIQQYTKRILYHNLVGLFQKCKVDLTY